MRAPYPVLSTILCAALLSFAALGLSERPAHALEGRTMAGLGVASTRPGSNFRQVGATSQFGLDLSLGDFVGLQAGIDAGFHPASSKRELERALITDLFIGARYNFDVFKYVPYIGLAAVGYLDSPPVGDPEEGRVPPSAGAKLSFGIIWRPRRHWSMTGLVELHGAAPALADFGLYAVGMLQVGYHWRL